MKLKLTIAISFLAIQLFSQDIERLYSELNPSVVTILVKENKLVNAGPNDVRQVSAEGLGSGVYVSEEGYIITASHVVHNAESIMVLFPNGEKAPAKVKKEEPKEKIKTYLIDVMLYTDEEKDNVWNQRAKVGVKEAKYKGKDVPLNKPKRGGSKKFFVYTKNKKGNVVKVSFGGTTGLSVKIKEKGARASFAARHKCATKKDKTKPGYWACNVGRYWKSLGGAKNFSGYW